MTLFCPPDTNSDVTSQKRILIFLKGGLKELIFILLVLLEYHICENS